MSWVITRATHQTWQRLRNDFLAVPRPVRARFAWTLTFAWLALLGAVLAVSLWLDGERGERLDAWERPLLERLVEAAPLDYAMAVFFESPGNGVMLLPLTVGAAVVFARRREPLRAVSVLASTLLAAVVVGLGWLAWDRDRPDFLYPGLPPGSLRSFPSGHMGLAIPFYGLLLWLWAQRSGAAAERLLALLLLLLVMFMVGTARLVLSAHWPSDMVGGTVIGAAWLVAVVLALRRAEAQLAREPGTTGPGS